MGSVVAVLAASNWSTGAEPSVQAPLKAKLTGATGSGTVVISVQRGKKELTVVVKALKRYSGKTIGFGFKKGKNETSVGKIKLDQHGNGTLTTDTFPAVIAGEGCGVYEETLAHPILLSGEFTKG
jgi:hypothetical protein